MGMTTANAAASQTVTPDVNAPVQPTYELTVDGAAEAIDYSGLAGWMADNLEPEDHFGMAAPPVRAILELKPGQSYGESLDGFNAASWLVRRVS